MIASNTEWLGALVFGQVTPPFLVMLKRMPAVIRRHFLFGEDENMKEFAKKFYNSSAWRQCRASYISERINTDGGLCEKCGQRVGYIVHHKIALTPGTINNPEISLSHDNLMYVCKPCHDEEEGHFVRRKKGCCVFAADGQPIDMRKLDG